jgi:hypothetical protein
VVQDGDQALLYIIHVEIAPRRLPFCIGSPTMSTYSAYSNH